MGITDAFIGAVLTLIGVISGAFLQYYIGGFLKRREALKALFEELKDAKRALEDIMEQIKEKGKGIAPISTRCYIQARDTGALSKLSKEDRKLLWNIYMRLEMLDRLAMAGAFGSLFINDWHKFSAWIKKLINDVEQALNIVSQHTDA